MKDNLVFILIVFLFIVTILVYFPNQKNKKLQIRKNEKVIQVEKDNNYAAVVTQDVDNKIIPNSPLTELELTPIESNRLEKIKEFKISNVKILDSEMETKDTFIFNEFIKIVFDYELPEGFYTFGLETIPDIKINMKDDILRQGDGSTDDMPLIFSVSGDHDLEDLKIKKINILVFKTNDFESPVYNHVMDTNITVKNLNINLVREDDYTTPLILGNA